MVHPWRRSASSRGECALIALAMAGGGGAAGCSDDGGGAPQPRAVAIELTSAPLLVSFRDEQSTGWQELPIDGAASLELFPVGRYEVVIACRGSGERPVVDVAHYGRAAADEPLIEHTCLRSARPYSVSGAVNQSGLLAISDLSMGSTSLTGWPFHFEVAPGAYDLLMVRQRDSVGLPDEFGVRRDVVVARDLDLGDIDLGQEDLVPMVPLEVSATNHRAGETLSSDVTVNTGTTDGLLSFRLNDWKLSVVPSSALLATDRQSIQLFAFTPRDAGTGQSATRWISRDVRDASALQVTLPEPLAPVTFAVEGHTLTATWSSLPDYDELSLYRQSIGNRNVAGRSHHISLSRAFMAETRATSLTLDVREVAGFQTEWLHDPALAQSLSLTARRTSPGEIFTSNIQQTVSAGRSAGEGRQ